MPAESRLPSPLATVSLLAKMADSDSALEPSDTDALSPEQRERLLNFKIRLRIANETYLREHKELPLLLSGFLREVLLKRPDNIREFAAVSEQSLPDIVTPLPWTDHSNENGFPLAMEKH